MKITNYMIAFILGVIAGIIMISALSYNQEIPKALGIYENPNAPSDWVAKENIHIYSDKVVIDIKGASISSYASSGSMKPLLDEYSNGIRVIPENAEQIKIGDIVSFERNNELIVHRVIEKGNDENGTYFITKGDNNSDDDGKVYFKDVKYVTIGVIW